MHFTKRWQQRNPEGASSNGLVKTLQPLNYSFNDYSVTSLGLHNATSLISLRYSRPHPNRVSAFLGLTGGG